MPQEPAKTQAEFTESVTVRVTQEERAALRFVAAAENKTESDLLRTAIEGVVIEADRIRAIIAESKGEAA